MTSPTLRGVIFDMDGVLTDSEPFIIEAATRMFLERHHLAVKHGDFLPFTGAGEDRFLGGVAEKYGVRLAMPDDKLRTYAIYLEIIRGRLHPLAGAVEFIQECRRLKLKCAVATSADRVKMDGNLKEIGIPPSRFDAIVTGSEIERKKPDPQAFQVAAQRLRLDNAECIVVEDAVNGVRAGKAVQARACLGSRRVSTQPHCGFRRCRLDRPRLGTCVGGGIAVETFEFRAIQRFPFRPPPGIFIVMTLASEQSPDVAWLVPVAGPPMPAVELKCSPRGLLVGRLEHCEIRLAVDSVSRRSHARGQV